MGNCNDVSFNHRANKIPNKPTSLRKSMKAAETEMKAKKNE